MPYNFSPEKAELDISKAWHMQIARSEKIKGNKRDSDFHASVARNISDFLARKNSQRKEGVA